MPTSAYGVCSWLKITCNNFQLKCNNIYIALSTIHTMWKKTKAKQSHPSTRQEQTQEANVFCPSSPIPHHMDSPSKISHIHFCLFISTAIIQPKLLPPLSIIFLELYLSLSSSFCHLPIHSLHNSQSSLLLIDVCVFLSGSRTSLIWHLPNFQPRIMSQSQIQTKFPLPAFRFLFKCHLLSESFSGHLT